jgi:hypothetical protein
MDWESRIQQYGQVSIERLNNMASKLANDMKQQWIYQSDPETLYRNVIYLEKQSMILQSDQKIRALIRDVIKNKLFINQLKQIQFSDYINGICHGSYLVDPNRYKKKIFILGEKHLPVNKPSVLDLIKHYQKHSSVFIDFFIEGHYYEKSFERGEADEKSVKNLDAVKWIFENMTCETVPYRAHRFDIRFRFLSRFQITGDIGLTNERPRLKKFFHGVNTLGDFYNKLEDIWKTDTLLQKEKSKVVDTSLVNDIYIMSIEHVKKNMKGLDANQYPGYIENVFDRLLDLILNGNVYDISILQYRLFSDILITMTSIIADWYMLLRLFKRFNSDIHPATADNCIIYGGTNHTDFYYKFLLTHGFENRTTNIGLVQRDNCVLGLQNPLPLLEQYFEFLRIQITLYKQHILRQLQKH